MTGILRFGVALLAFLAPTWASAFCRTTTERIPSDFIPQPGACFEQGLPLWWRNACVSYSIHKNASRQISYDDAANVIATAFARWTGTSCPSAEGAPSRVSIDIRDQGAVTCDRIEYTSGQPNQHVIVFRDDVWPHSDPNNTLAITTIRYNPKTGEIYNADMEVNSTLKLTLADPVPPDGYDFASAITHEAGHFLGLAHSGDRDSVMFARYEPGSTRMRNLTIDDVQGICAIYPPEGIRPVGPGVAPNDRVVADPCDPTPRFGFSTECGSSQKGTCGLGVAGTNTSPPLFLLTPLLLLFRSRKRA